MKKIFSFLFIIAGAISLSSCQSAESKAKSIYNDTSLTNREKIDELMSLYYSSSKHANNSGLSDKAWDAICDGNYDLALGLINSYGGDSYNYYCLYYVHLLQEDVPVPELKLKIYGNGTSAFYSYSINAEDATPKYGFSYKFYVTKYSSEHESLDSELIDTGEQGKNSLTFKRSFDSFSLKGHDSFIFKFNVNPYCNSIFDYYTSSDEFSYSIDINDIKDGEYSCTYTGMSSYFIE